MKSLFQLRIRVLGSTVIVRDDALEPSHCEVFRGDGLNAEDGANVMKLAQAFIMSYVRTSVERKEEILDD